jgi:hypothetical protein
MEELLRRLRRLRGCAMVDAFPFYWHHVEGACRDPWGQLAAIIGNDNMVLLHSIYASLLVLLMQVGAQGGRSHRARASASSRPAQTAPALPQAWWPQAWWPQQQQHQC